MSRRKSNTDGCPRWVRPEAVPALIQLAAKYGELWESLDAALVAFRAADGVEPWLYPEHFTVDLITDRLRVAGQILPNPISVGRSQLFNMLCGFEPWGLASVQRAEAAALRELGRDGFEVVRPLLEQERQRRRRERRLLPAGCA